MNYPVLQCRLSEPSGINSMLQTSIFFFFFFLKQQFCPKHQHFSGYYATSQQVLLHHSPSYSLKKGFLHPRFLQCSIYLHKLKLGGNIEGLWFFFFLSGSQKSIFYTLNFRKMKGFFILTSEHRERFLNRISEPYAFEL